MKLTEEQRDVFIAKILTVWKATNRPTISLEKDVYISLFSFLTPIHTVHDKLTGDPVIFLFPRKKAIDQTKKQYNMREAHGS